MKNDKLKIVIMTKDFLFSINDILCRFPNNEKVLKDKFRITLYEIMENIYKSNYLPLEKYTDDRIKLQIDIMAKISLLDLLLEESYRKGYITENIFIDKSNVLTNICNKVKGWISYEKSISKGNV